MRRTCFLLLSGAALFSVSPAFAADALRFGPAPSWVTPQPIPSPPVKAKEQPVAILLHDQQTLLEPGKITTYSEVAFKIQKPEGLAAGNLSISWNPATDTVTVHKVEIRRNGKPIDVLGAGQTFTTMRRESNLESAMLDGVLTANIQPEGLQEGDIVVFTTTSEHVDPVLKGHLETTFAPWGAAEIGLAHARLTWPATVSLRIQKTGDLPAPQQTMRDGRRTYELAMQDIDPVVAPKSAPLRYAVGRMGEATDFRSWSDAAALMIPLYREAAVIPATGALREEVEKIRKGSMDPKARAEQALQLVQQRVRYVALLMGEGGYVPAPAEMTWSRRFGDCKAKTALLLAILHELGIEAEPVLVNSKIGDAIGERLPMIALFDHVLVQAHLGGKTYWLDGTRTGDMRLDDIQTPDFGWGLPVVNNASLVHIVPPPLERPNGENRIEIDATKGVLAPTRITISTTYRGDAAVALNTLYAQASAQQREDALRDAANKVFDGFTMTSSSLQFDKVAREVTLIEQGTAKLKWKDGWFGVPSASLGYNPDFQRTTGPLHDAPFATNYPNYEHRLVVIHLPQGFGTQEKLPAPVQETLAGVEYRRSASLARDTLTIESSERTVVPEVSYKEAIADEAPLRKLSDDDVYLRLPAGYRPTSQDTAALSTDKPASADEFADRGNTFMNGGKYEEAIADFTQAIALDPKNVNALADRALAHVWNHDFPLAEKDLAAVEALEPGNAVMFRARGLTAEIRGECTKAVDFYTRSLTTEPNNIFAIGHRATCEAALSKNEEALADSAQALKARPSWIDLRILRANIFMHESKRDLVAAEAEALTRDNPDSGYAWVAAANTYAALDQRDRAMQALERALAIKPEAYIYINRAEVRPSSDIAGRSADLDAALKLEPQNAEALLAKAQLLSEAGDRKGVLKLLDLIKPDPADDYAQEERAALLYKAGRVSEAEKVFESARSAAKSPTQLNNLCWAKATTGVMLDSALQDCRDALKMSPGTGPYLDSLGLVLLKLGRLDEALGAYNQAVAKETGAASLMGRAFVYLRKGDLIRANADAAAARKLHGDIDALFAHYGLKFDASSRVDAASAR